MNKPRKLVHYGSCQTAVVAKSDVDVIARNDSAIFVQALMEFDVYSVESDDLGPVLDIRAVGDSLTSSGMSSEGDSSFILSLDFRTLDKLQSSKQFKHCII